MKPIISLRHLALAACLTLPMALHAAPDNGRGAPDHRHGRCEARGPMEHARGGPGGPGDFAEHGFKRLNLSEAQKDQIFTIRHNQEPLLRDQGKQRRQAFEDLRALSDAPSYDDAKAQQVAERLASLEKASILERTRTQAKILAVLTPEQRQQLQQFKAEREQRRDERPVDFKQPRPAARPVNS